MALGDSPLGNEIIGIPLMPLIVRNKGAGTVALAHWVLADGTPVTVKLTQAEHDSGPRNFPPATGATLLIACGGIPALNTVDGYPHKGDCWEENGTLVIATSDNFDWSRTHAVASDPGGSQESTLTGFSIASTGNRVRLTQWNDGTLRSFNVDTVAKSLTNTVIDMVIPNSRSVTFDSQDSGTGTGATVTIAGGTVATQTDRYLAALVASPIFGVTLTGVTWNSDALTQRITADMTVSKRLEYWDMIAPDQVTGDLVCTYDASNDCAAGWVSCYGVDQATPRTATNSATGTSTAPSITITSAVGELAITGTATTNNSGTVTTDATWVEDWNITAASWDPTNAGAHKAGAAPSVTRTDGLTNSVEWAIMGASIKAASAGGQTFLFTPSRTDGLGHGGIFPGGRI